MWNYFTGSLLDTKKMNKQKINFSIQRLKEFGLCNKHQKEIKSIDDVNIILNIVCDEIKNE